MPRFVLLPLLLFAFGNARAQDTPVERLNSVQVYGSVTDSLTGKPVYDSLVEYYTADGKRKAVCSVNSDGTYAMFIPSGRTFTLRIVKENGYRSMSCTVAAIPYGIKQFRRNLLLQPRDPLP